MSKQGDFNTYPHPFGGNQLPNFHVPQFPPYPYTQMRRDQWSAWYPPDNIRPENLNMNMNIGIMTSPDRQGSQNFRANIDLSASNTTPPASREPVPTPIATEPKQTIHTAPEPSRPPSGSQDSSDVLLSCKICKKAFTCTLELEKHELIHLDVKSANLTCPVCDKTFTHRRHLKKHEQIHMDMQKSFTCKICNQHFIQKYHLKKHQLTHLDESLQGKAEKQQLNPVNDNDEANIAASHIDGSKDLHAPRDDHHTLSHSSQHSAPVGLLSPLSQISEDLLINKIGMQGFAQNNSHSVFPGNQLGGIREIETPTIDYSMQTSSSHQQALTAAGIHVEDVKKVEQLKIEQLKNALKCRVCEKKFSRKDLLLKHELTHLNTFKCRVCEQEFMQKEALKEHELTHKVYKCNICQAGFTTLRSLKRHDEQQHQIDDAPVKKQNRNASKYCEFKCIYCDREFTRAQNLKEHELTHTVANPFKCSICQTGYSTKRSMKRHERNHKIALGLPVEPERKRKKKGEPTEILSDLHQQQQLQQQPQQQQQHQQQHHPHQQHHDPNQPKLSTLELSQM